MTTPAEIAAEAAHVATQWAQERPVFERSAKTFPELAPLFDAIEALLAERERLRGLVAASHLFRLAVTRDTTVTECSCGEWQRMAMDSATHETTVTAHRRHVADVLEGRA